jgi:predicted nucleic acid-binding protein
VGTVVVDSSILLGFIDPTDAHYEGAKRAIAENKEAGNSFLVPTVVLAETMVGTARRGRQAVERTRTLLTTIFGPPRVIDDNVAVEAAYLRAKHKSLRLPDALVIATGIVDHADTILTADKRWESIDKRVEVLT